MKPSTILPILTLLLPQVLAATDYQNAMTCGQRFPRINGAIEKFCYKKNTSGVATNDLVIPSAYASIGSMFYGFKGNKLVVQITGQCSPAQWVPAQWCLSQFHEMCAQASHPLGKVEERKRGRMYRGGKQRSQGVKFM
ncbi:hypothetical protein B0A48_07128 [Cryoendolithus antarcticus]|uniref:Uncharacterized protein n=1 Tax=Cryoendolithus antarcticus TaxID=1507870 RepID=A0A1V8T853_9PEZI|nr:hypothetical protein B0A48_07128 [Cryoendolithus antarcticus]